MAEVVCVSDNNSATCTCVLCFCCALRWCACVLHLCQSLHTWGHVKLDVGTAELWWDLVLCWHTHITVLALVGL